MLSAVGIVAPIFLIIVLGYLAGRARYLSDGASRLLVEFVFRLAIPALMFRILATASYPEISPLPLWGAFFGALALVWATATIVSRGLLAVPAADAATLSLTACFGNLLLLGLPITLAHLGPEAGTPMALILLIEFPAMMFAATLQLELAEPGGNRRGALAILGSLTSDLARNPIIVAMIAGATWRLTNLGIAPAVDRMLGLLAQSVAPTSLFALGLTLSTFSVSGQTGTIALLVVLKLVALPAVGWLLAFHVFELPRLWAAVVVLFLAMPTGAVPYLFAMRYGRAVDSVSAAIAIGVGVSALTLSVVLFLLGEPVTR